MKYSLPEEPPIGSKVITPLGFVYERKATSDPSGRNWELDGIWCNWKTLCAVGVEDYEETNNGEAYFLRETPSYYPKLRVRVDGKWKYFYFNTDGNFFGNSSAGTEDEIEWRKI